MLAKIFAVVCATILSQTPDVGTPSKASHTETSGWQLAKVNKNKLPKLKKNRGEKNRQGADSDAPRSKNKAAKNTAPLDLSQDAGSLDLSQPLPSPGKKANAKGSAQPDSGGIDFGGGLDLGAEPAAASGGDGLSFDFGSDESIALELGSTKTGDSAERQRFEAAIRMMSNEQFGKAAMEFKFFIGNPQFADFQQESDYQLAKSLYKMDFYEAALTQFETILEKGVAHRRYRKSVEWLFFMSRKMADQTPVLAKLARYRNVTFPKSFQSEYHYLLAKYLFVQANDFEVKKLQEAELARGKQSKAAGIDFGAVADAIEGAGGGGSLDFGGGGAGAATDAGGGFDFGAASLDFGGASDMGGGAMDFGAAPAAGGGSDAMDFGAPAAGGGADGGSLDFGAAPPPMEAPVVQTVATNSTEAVKQALDLIEQVEKESSYAPRAQYLTGLLHYIGGSDQKAVEAFQEVVRLLGPKSDTFKDPKLREMAFLSLARIHYGYKQFNRSAYYYDQIDRDSDNWLTSLFEASWAFFRRGDFDKALGNLLTLHSPFFEREYFPESQIVKAVIYFEACRYPETRMIVDEFLKRFTALMREMQKIAESKESPEVLNASVAELQVRAQREHDEVTERVVALTLSSPEIQMSSAAIKELEAQKTALAKMDETFRQSTLGVNLGEQLNAALLARSREAGEVVKAKFEQELYKLKSLLAQALRIKIEVTRAEREAIERKIQGQESDAIVAAEERITVDDEHVYWPYEGEYWRDELGTYELDFSMCQQSAR